MTVSLEGASERLLTPAEAAAMFRVTTGTLTRWAKAQKIGYTRTLGGHRRYREAEVKALLRRGQCAAAVHETTSEISQQAAA
jgi:excisionase family DNA binding protein